MTAPLDLFADATPRQRALASLGLRRNPFDLPEGQTGTGPFYREHIAKELRETNNWVAKVLADQHVRALSLVGEVGLGKTEVLHRVVKSLERIDTSPPVYPLLVRLTDQSYARATAGAILVSALERHRVRGLDVPEGVLPLVWAAVAATAPHQDGLCGRTSGVLDRARRMSGEGRVYLARSLSEWLRRGPVTPKVLRDLQVARRLEFEGEAVIELIELMDYAVQVGGVSAVLVAIDQFEELTRLKVYEEGRRARLLTDIRTLLDLCEKAHHVGVLMSWTPSLEEDDGRGGKYSRKLQDAYPALYTRLDRIRVDLPGLTRDHALGFVLELVKYARIRPDSPGPNEPIWSEWIPEIWDSLARAGKLAGQTVAPRAILAELSQRFDRLLGTDDIAPGQSFV